MAWPSFALLAVLVVVAAAIGAGVATLVLANTRRRGQSRTTVPPQAASGGTAAAASGDEMDHQSFGYIVSHDLRAPIRVVEGFTKIVKEDYASVIDRTGLDHLDRVLGAAARMNHMIDALLALSRLSAQPLASMPVDLSLLAGHVVDELRRQSPGRSVSVQIEPALAATGDPTLLRMVLENLLGNAWKYTGNTADARIGLVRDAAVPNGYVVFDNGAGFDMRYAQRLFGVFQRLHSASEFPGTGVGLASVQRVVQRHGGTIRAEAEIDRGARFYFSLGHAAPAGASVSHIAPLDDRAAA